MTFSVITDPDANNDLADIWMQAPDRRAVQIASDRIDALLRSAPLSHGTGSGRERVLYEPPLAAAYTVKLEDRQVNITKYYYLE